jgi:hypothetical protein
MAAGGLMSDEREVTWDYDPSLKPTEGEDKLNRSDTRKIVDALLGYERLGVDDFAASFLPGQGGRFAEESAKGRALAKLTSIIPEELLYESVLRRVDLRPLLAQVMSGNPAGAGIKLNGMTFSAEERYGAGQLFLQVQQQAENQARTVGTQQGLTGEALKTYVKKASRLWAEDRKEVGVGPIGLGEENRAAAEAEAEGTTAPAPSRTSKSWSDTYDEYARNQLADESIDGLPSEEDMRRLFQLDLADASNLWAAEATRAQALENGVDAPSYQVDAGDLFGVPRTATPMRLPPQAQGTQAMRDLRDNAGKPASTKSSVLSMMTTLYGRKPDEIRKLQEKLSAAGYFDQWDGEPEFMGMDTDARTQQAWKSLVQEGFKTNKSLSQILKERTQARKLDEEAGLKNDVRLTDSAGIRIGSDTVGQQVLGRKLTDDERSRLVRFIHGLELAEGKKLDKDSNDAVESVDVGARIEEWTRSANPVEAGAYDVLSQFDTLQSIIRGG